jgi:membrane-anchored glycerophosphoryl diester phosphodiesterase (GDPDase)
MSPVFMLAPDSSLQDSWTAAILWLFVGFLAIFIAFAIIGVRLWITVPAIAVEQPGVLAALRRSWDLTRGHFWRLFGVLLVMWLGTLAMSMVAGIVIGVLSVFGGVTGIFVGQGLNILVSIIANALFAVAAAVVYVELRRAKEGFGLEDIAAVFD